MKRLEKTLGKPVKGDKGKKQIEKEDRERARYYNTFTGKKWLDLREYDFVLNTTPFTDAQIEELLVQFIKMRFPEL